MKDDFITPEFARHLQSLSEEDWLDLTRRWDERKAPEPTRFKDGSLWCDCGREVERKMWVLIHKDDRSTCTQELK